MDFHSMKRKELQALCKKHNIPANLTNLEMVDKLSSLHKEKEKPMTRERSCLNSTGEHAVEINSDGVNRNPKKEKEKPMTRGRSCLKSMGEQATEINSSGVDRNPKKVRFSPENEIIECSRLEVEPVETRRGARRKSSMRPAVRNEGIFTEEIVGNVDNLVKVTRSRAEKGLNEGVNLAVSPTVETKRGRRGLRSVGMQRKNGASGDNLASDCAPVKETRVLTRRSSENREVERKQEEEVKNVAVLSMNQTERSLRKRNVKSDYAVSEIEKGLKRKTGEVKDVVLRKNQTGRASKKRTMKLDDEITEDNRLTEDVGIVHTEAALRRSKRNTRRVEDKAQLNLELGKIPMVGRGRITRQQNQLVENAAIIETTTNTEAVIEAVLQLEESSRHSSRIGNRRQSVMPRSEKLGTNEFKAENEKRRLVKGSASDMGMTSKNLEEIGRPRRSSSRRKSIVVSDAVLDDNDKKNKSNCRRRDPVSEEETSVNEGASFVKEPPCQPTQNGAKAQRAVLAVGTGKAVRRKKLLTRSKKPNLQAESSSAVESMVLNQQLTKPDIAETGTSPVMNCSEVLSNNNVEKTKEFSGNSRGKEEVHMETVDLEGTNSLKMINSVEIQVSDAENLRNDHEGTQGLMPTEVDKEKLLQDYKVAEDDYPSHSSRMRNNCDSNNLALLEPEVGSNVSMDVVSPEATLKEERYSGIDQSDCIAKPAEVLDLEKEMEIDINNKSEKCIDSSCVMSHNGVDDHNSFGIEEQHFVEPEVVFDKSDRKRITYIEVSDGEGHEVEKSALGVEVMDHSISKEQPSVNLEGFELKNYLNVEDCLTQHNGSSGTKENFESLSEEAGDSSFLDICDRKRITPCKEKWRELDEVLKSALGAAVLESSVGKELHTEVPEDGEERKHELKNLDGQLAHHNRSIVLKANFGIMHEEAGDSRFLDTSDGKKMTPDKVEDKERVEIENSALGVELLESTHSSSGMLRVIGETLVETLVMNSSSAVKGPPITDPKLSKLEVADSVQSPSVTSRDEASEDTKTQRIWTPLFDFGKPHNDSVVHEREIPSNGSLVVMEKENVASVDGNESLFLDSQHGLAPWSHNRNRKFDSTASVSLESVEDLDKVENENTSGADSQSPLPLADHLFEPSSAFTLSEDFETENPVSILEAKNRIEFQEVHSSAVQSTYKRAGDDYSTESEETEGTETDNCTKSAKKNEFDEDLCNDNQHSEAISPETTGCLPAHQGFMSNNKEVSLSEFRLLLDDDMQGDGMRLNSTSSVDVPSIHSGCVAKGKDDDGSTERDFFVGNKLSREEENRKVVNEEELLGTSECKDQDAQVIGSCDEGLAETPCIESRISLSSLAHGTSASKGIYTTNLLEEEESNDHEYEVATREITASVASDVIADENAKENVICLTVKKADFAYKDCDDLLMEDVNSTGQRHSESKPVSCDFYKDNVAMELDNSTSRALDKLTIGKGIKDLLVVSNEFEGTLPQDDDGKFNDLAGHEMEMVQELGLSERKVSPGCSDHYLGHERASIEGQGGEFHVYQGDLSFDAEGRKVNGVGQAILFSDLGFKVPSPVSNNYNEDMGNARISTGNSFQESENETIEKFGDKMIGVTPDGSRLEENVRSFQRHNKMQVRDHGDAMEELTFVGGSGTPALSKSTNGAEIKSSGEMSEDSPRCTHNFNDTVQCVGDTNVYECRTSEATLECNMFSSWDINLFSEGVAMKSKSATSEFLFTCQDTAVADVTEETENDTLSEKHNHSNEGKVDSYVVSEDSFSEGDEFLKKIDEAKVSNDSRLDEDETFEIDPSNVFTLDATETEVSDLKAREDGWKLSEGESIANTGIEVTSLFVLDKNKCEGMTDKTIGSYETVLSSDSVMEDQSSEFVDPAVHGGAPAEDLVNEKGNEDDENDIISEIQISKHNVSKEGKVDTCLVSEDSFSEGDEFSKEIDEAKESDDCRLSKDEIFEIEPSNVSTLDVTETAFPDLEVTEDGWKFPEGENIASTGVETAFLYVVVKNKREGMTDGAIEPGEPVLRSNLVMEDKSSEFVDPAVHGGTMAEDSVNVKIALVESEKGIEGNENYILSEMQMGKQSLSKEGKVDTCIVSEDSSSESNGYSKEIDEVKESDDYRLSEDEDFEVEPPNVSTLGITETAVSDIKAMEDGWMFSEGKNSSHTGVEASPCVIDKNKCEGIANEATEPCEAALRSDSVMEDRSSDFADPVVHGGTTADGLVNMKHALVELEEGNVEQLNSFIMVRDDVRTTLKEEEFGVESNARDEVDMFDDQGLSVSSLFPGEGNNNIDDSTFSMDKCFQEYVSSEINGNETNGRLSKEQAVGTENAADKEQNFNDMVQCATGLDEHIEEKNSSQDSTAAFLSFDQDQSFEFDNAAVQGGSAAEDIEVWKQNSNWVNVKNTSEKEEGRLCVSKTNSTILKTKGQKTSLIQGTPKKFTTLDMKENAASVKRERGSVTAKSTARRRALVELHR